MRTQTLTMRTNRAAWALPAAVLCAAALSGCYLDASTDDDGLEDEAAVDRDAYWPPSLSSDATRCDELDPASSCYMQDDYTWRTSCRSQDCQSVEVFVHYMLTEDLGEGRVIHVEAFDNAHFQGAPVSTVTLNGFRAAPGRWDKAELFLEPGEYYLRAYLTDADSAVVPYELGGMELVADLPVGVHGALSSAQSIRVARRSQEPHADPVHIYLDKLFSQPGDAVDTKAHLRVALSVADATAVPDGRKVLVQLFDSPDLTYEPQQSFEMASEMLLVQGRVGRADFITPSLPAGQYVVFAFLDANGNGLHDETEPAAVYERNGEPRLVAIAANRTARISLLLAGPAAPQGDLVDATEPAGGQ
jgi:hypothetical protein